jgi:GT2 family glycosyltransferase
MRIALAIATTGRPEIVDDTLSVWAAQTRPYDRLVISAACPADVGPRAPTMRNVDVLFGPKGLTLQRNAALDHIGTDCDVVLFADDDYVPAARFIETMERLLTAEPDIAVITGYVVADGINTAGISFQDAVAIVGEYDLMAPERLKPVYTVTHAYGCNMAVRVTADPTLRFDPRLPLYGWLEDLDFSRRMAPHGRIVRSDDMIGVHMGTKRGRSPGVKFGYMQVANPLYFVGKRTMGGPEAAKQIARNVAANMAKTFYPEPWVDRLGRLRGNAIAFADLVAGRLKPERTIEL